MSDETTSELYRITAQRWVGLDSAASMLEESKSAYLSQKMAALGDMPVSRAELQVKASDEWKEYVTKMVNARTAANFEKVNMEFMRMRHSEQQSQEATARAERRL
jgi:ATP phosphoribosyltransferase